MNETIKPPNSFTNDTLLWILIKTGIKATIYQEKRDGEMINNYEVHKFRIKRNKYLIPTDEEFGKFGWSYSTLEYANKKFNSLEADKDERI